VSPTAGQALAYLQELNPDGITAASLLDRYGTEHARAVKGVVAPAGQLSYATTQQRFLASTLALPVGGVQHTEPYRSPHTRQLVVSSSAPVFDGGGAPGAWCTWRCR
jgi:hypothetical protein